VDVAESGNMVGGSDEVDEASLGIHQLVFIDVPKGVLEIDHSKSCRFHHQQAVSVTLSFPTLIDAYQNTRVTGLSRYNTVERAHKEVRQSL